jgi:hypothetical protein
MSRSRRGQPGVNLPITYRGRTLGVVGVTGDPGRVLPVAYAIKTSVESMVELEAYKDKRLQRYGQKEPVHHYSCYDDEAPRAAVESLAPSSVTKRMRPGRRSSSGWRKGSPRGVPQCREGKFPASGRRSFLGTP